jgi:triacylglycerol lipase
MPSLPPGYDNTLAGELARAGLLAYLQKSNHDAFLAGVATEGFQLVSEFSADLFGLIEPFGFIMKSGTRLVVAFRGTDSILDILADVDYAQSPLSLSPGLPSAGNTHLGFTAVYFSFRDALIQAAQQQSNMPVFVTGHSLGGAIATLAALDLAVNATNLPRPTMYTFAAPRIGDPQFAGLFDARFGNVDITSSWRVVNKHDLVPYLPPVDIFDPLHLSVLTYQHVVNWRPIVFQTGNALGNHSLQNYINNLS